MAKCLTVKIFDGQIIAENIKDQKGKRIMLEKMIPIIAEQLNVDEAEVKPEANFKDDLGADSLDLFELVMALEEEFDVEIPSEDLQSIATVSDVMEYLKGKGVEA